MAFFGKTGSSINVEAAYGYDKEYSAMQTLVECNQNELTLFTGLIQTDFQEASMIHEGASIEDIHSLQESVIGDFFKKLKDLFMKLLSKIKAIFHGFIAKFDSVFMKSSKAFAKKYRQEILTKDLGDATIQYSKPIKRDFVIQKSITIGLKSPNLDAKQIANALENFDADENETHYLKELTGVDANPEDFEKEYHDAMYDNEEEVDLKDVVSESLNILQGQDDLVKRVKKANDVLEKQIQDIVKDINKMDSDFSKSIKDTNDYDNKTLSMSVLSNKDRKLTRGWNISDDQYKGDKDNSAIQIRQKIITLLSRKAAACQRAVTKVTAGTIREAKFGGSQARRVVAKAVAAKGVSHESAYLTAVEEAAAYEAELELV